MKYTKKEKILMENTWPYLKQTRVNDSECV